MTLQINDIAPDFEARTTEGKIKFHDWIGDSWAVLFSHPKDFTPVCTTELGYMAKIKPEFDKRGVKLIGLSVDPVDKHATWAADIKETQGIAPNYPMIGDVDYNVSKLYGMLPAAVSGDPAKRTAADNQTVRNVFIIGPDKKIKLVLVYPMTVGRNFDEVLRVIDSLQLGAKHKVATPVNWKQGDDVIIAGSVNDDDAKKAFPAGLEVAEAVYPDRAATENLNPGGHDCVGPQAATLSAYPMQGNLRGNDRPKHALHWPTGRHPPRLGVGGRTCISAGGSTGRQRARRVSFVGMRDVPSAQRAHRGHSADRGMAGAELRRDHERIRVEEAQQSGDADHRRPNFQRRDRGAGGLFWQLEDRRTEAIESYNRLVHQGRR